MTGYIPDKTYWYIGGFLLIVQWAFDTSCDLNINYMVMFNHRHGDAKQSPSAHVQYARVWPYHTHASHRETTCRSRL
jgi:hypothetical protein